MKKKNHFHFHCVPTIDVHRRFHPIRIGLINRVIVSKQVHKCADNDNESLPSTTACSTLEAECWKRSNNGSAGWDPHADQITGASGQSVAG